MKENKRHLLPKGSVLDFIKGGKALLTVQNEKTSAHRTFRIRKADNADLYFVRILKSGQIGDKKVRWSYIGMINEKDIFILTPKSQVTASSNSFQSFRWLLNAAKDWHNGRDQYPYVVVFHEGKCGRCGRRLTDPHSIKMGFGPECIKKIGGK